MNTQSVTTFKLESVSTRSIMTSGKSKKPTDLKTYTYLSEAGHKVSFSLHPKKNDTRYYGQGTHPTFASLVVDAFLAVRGIGGLEPPLLIVRQ